MLSERVQDTLLPSPLYQSFARALGNPYHQTTNPDGIISLGIAENTLMYGELAKFLDENMTITPDLFGYSAVVPGLPSLREGLVRLYNSAPFDPVIPVTGQHLYFTAGCSALLDQLFWILCDEGEGVLIGKPLYGGFVNDMTIRSRATLVPVILKDHDAFSKEAVVRYEEELLRAEEKGIKVRALVLCTPHNPLGQCYPRDTMIKYMRLCQKYQIHLISDEIYALTTFPTKDIPNPTPFTSLLSIEKDGIIDPSLCHIVHGMSKDFCANGVRFGMLITQANVDILTAFRAIGLFSIPSSLAFLALSTMLNNQTFLTKFMTDNRTLLIEHYEICTQFLRNHAIPYIPSNAGFFIWVDLTAYLNAMDGTSELEKERTMNYKLLDAGVHLATSEAFYGEDYGWFRITFTVQKETLLLGLKRMVEAIGAGKETATTEMARLKLEN